METSGWCVHVWAAVWRLQLVNSGQCPEELQWRHVGGLQPSQPHLARPGDPLTGVC